ncbi:MAG: hypothetical protein A2X59_02550 [Nitrospirae bacterium GWC2_42_7]|nr:MAG: hypothetical protein A2X59_02550 [Nitrospirae bacterium GWC2_42_7]
MKTNKSKTKTKKAVKAKKAEKISAKKPKKAAAVKTKKVTKAVTTKKKTIAKVKPLPKEAKKVSLKKKPVKKTKAATPKTLSKKPLKKTVTKKPVRTAPIKIKETLKKPKKTAAKKTKTATPKTLSKKPLKKTVTKKPGRTAPKKIKDAVEAKVKAKVKTKARSKAKTVPKAASKPVPKKKTAGIIKTTAKTRTVRETRTVERKKIEPSLAIKPVKQIAIPAKKLSAIEITIKQQLKERSIKPEKTNLKIFLPQKEQVEDIIQEVLSTGLKAEYGENDFFIMPIDPKYTFVNWEITGEAFLKAKGTLNIRAYDITGIIFDGNNFNKFFDININNRSGSGFFEINMQGCDVVMEIGFLQHDGRFNSIIRSNIVTIPSLMTFDELGIVLKLYEAGVPVGY